MLTLRPAEFTIYSIVMFVITHFISLYPHDGEYEKTLINQLIMLELQIKLHDVSFQ